MTKREELEGIGRVGQFSAACIYLGMALLLTFVTLQTQHCDEEEDAQGQDDEYSDYISALLPWVSASVIVWTIMRDFDQALGDVPEQIEHLPRYSYPEKFCSIDGFRDNNESDQHTGFSKEDC